MGGSPLDDHFRSPRNAGVLEKPDVEVRVENPVCGDLLHLYLRLGPDRRVAAATFQVYGCPAAIAAGSVLTELVRGRGPAELGALGEKAIDAALGGLRGESAHAAVLAADAVREALRALSAPRAGGSGR